MASDEIVPSALSLEGETKTLHELKVPNGLLEAILSSVEAEVVRQPDTINELSVNDFIQLLSSRAKPIQMAAREGQLDVEQRLWIEIAAVAVTRAMIVEES